MVEALTIDISWAKPLDTGFANETEPITNYILIMAKSNTSTFGNFTDFELLFNSSCTNKTCTVRQSFNSSRITPYYFRIFASNQLGYNSSAYADSQNQSITTPSKPLSIQAKVAAPASINLSWSRPLNTGVGDMSRSLVEFLILRARGSSNLSCTCYCESCSDCSSCSLVDSQCCNLTTRAVSGLTFSYYFSNMVTGPTRYYFQVLAANDAGYGPPSAITNEQSITRPSIPTNLSAVNSAPNTVTLSWSKPANTGAGVASICGQDCRNITGYRISCSAFLSDLPVECNQTENLLDTVAPWIYRFEIHDLNHKADSYSFQIAALNDAGWSNVSILYPVFSINVPSEPVSLHALISNIPFVVDISWASPLDTGSGGLKVAILRYVLEMSLSGNFSNSSDLTVVCDGLASCANCTCGDLNASIAFSTYREIPFFFRAKAQNLVGFGPYSSLASSPSIGLPSEPLNLTAKAGPGVLKVNLNWKNPLDMGWGVGRYRPLSGFRIFQSFNNSEFTACQNSAMCKSMAANAVCCFYEINNSTNFSGTMPFKTEFYFYFRVEAMNEAGLGRASAYAREQGVSYPGQPLNLSIEVLEPGDRFLVGWEPPFDFGVGLYITTRPLDFYVVEVCQGPQNSTQCSFPPLGSLYDSAVLSANSLSFISTDYVGGKTYFFRVAAQNDVSLGNWSNIVFHSAISLPTSPRNFTCMVLVPLQIDLSWNIPLNTGDGGNMHIPVLYYIINVSSSLNFSQEEKNLFTGLAFQLNYTGLVKGQDYYFRIWARTAAGLSMTFESASEQGITVPSVPLNLEAQTTAPLIIQLLWGVPIDTGLGGEYIPARKIDFYLLQAQTSNVHLALPNFSVASQFTLNSLSYNFSAVQVGYYYYFRVQAHNSAGYSNFSLIQSERGIGIPGVPQRFSAFVSGSLVITVLWSLPLDTGLGLSVQPSMLLINSGYILLSSYDNFANQSVEFNLPSNETSIIFGSLMKNRTYSFRIKSRNAVGQSNLSATLSVRAISLPTAPRNLQILVSTLYERQLVLSWNLPLDTGEGDSSAASVLFYRLVQMVNNGSTVVAENLKISALVTTATMRNLSKGTVYYYQIFANNAAGEGNGSNLVSEMALDTPSAPYFLSASISGPVAIFLKWNRPNDTGNGIGAMYPRPLIMQNVSVNVSGSVKYVSVPGGATNYSLSYPYITQGSFCIISVSAENSAGFSPWSVSVSQIAINISTAPRNLFANIFGPLSINLGWSQPVNTGSFGDLWPLLNYTLLVSQDELFLDYKIIMESLGTSFNHTGLVKGVKYFYKVFALNEAGISSSSNVAFNFAITTPTAPTSFRVDVSGEYQLLVAWALPLDTGIGDQIWSLSSYTLQWDSTLGSNGMFLSEDRPFAGSLQLSQSVLQYIFTGLTKGNTYFFRVFTSNQAGKSGYAGPSTEQAMVFPSTVLNFQSVLEIVLGHAAWDLTWQTPSETGTGNISAGQYPLPSAPGKAQAIIAYVVQAGPSNTGILSVNWSTFVSESPDLNATFVPLIPNLVYYFRIAAVNKAGQGSWLYGGNTGPSIISLSPKMVPAVGGIGITVVGTKFGESSLNLVGTVGETKCISIYMLRADTSVMCIAPPGTGGSKDFKLSVAGLSVILEKSVVYAAPSVTSIEPTVASSDGYVKISVFGNNFGSRDTAPEALLIGKAPCACSKTVWISDSSLFCITPRVKRGQQRNFVQVLVDGIQSSVRQDVVFEYNDFPSYLDTCIPEISDECFDCVVSSCYSLQVSKSFSEAPTLLSGDVLQFCELTAAKFCGYQDFLS